MSVWTILIVVYFVISLFIIYSIRDIFDNKRRGIDQTYLNFIMFLVLLLTSPVVALFLKIRDVIIKIRRKF